jgi:ABC-2 type transport system ATP-binding protein
VKNPLETKRQLAYIPETVMLYGNLSGLENLSYFSKLGGHYEYSDDDLRKLLRRVTLPAGSDDSRIDTYSKGMRQKVGIAIALARRAKAVLLDEPTSGLDPKASNEFSLLLKDLQATGRQSDGGHDLFRAKETGPYGSAGALA